jgi:deazaflavin-dependent oxidoreductase (nitroreductase family)
VGLLQAGREAVLVDRQAEGANTSRAAVVYPRTLELLAPYSVADRLAARAIKTPSFSIRDRDRKLASIQFQRLPTAYPHALFVSQAVTESVLLDRFQELGGEVQRPLEFVGLEQEQDHVTATFADGRKISTAYLVGADGVHSTVRRAVGLEFDLNGLRASFSLGDLRISGGVPDDELVVYFSPAGHMVVLPLPGGIHRLVANVANAPADPDAAFFQRLLDDRGPRAERAVVDEVLWGSRFLVAHGVAGRYRAGRVLLAGDAAHTHSPLGGQGMNTGLADAVALARTLAAAQESGGSVLLDRYAEVQRPVAEDVVRISDTLTWLATMSGIRRTLRNIAIRASSPIISRRLAWRLSMLVYRQRQEPIFGRPAPDATSVPRFVRIFDPLAAALLRRGLPVGPNALLTVRGRKSGQPHTTTVALFEADGKLWTQGAFGEVNWVRNLRAAGTATLNYRGKEEVVNAVELSREEAADVFSTILGPQVHRFPPPLRWVLPRLLGIEDIVRDPQGAAERHPVFELRKAS